MPPYDDIFSLKRQITNMGAVNKDHAHVLADPMYRMHYLKNRAYLSIRYEIFASYGIGIVLISIPTIATFVSVVRHTILRGQTQG